MLRFRATSARPSPLQRRSQSRPAANTRRSALPNPASRRRRTRPAIHCMNWSSTPRSETARGGDRPCDWGDPASLSGTALMSLRNLGRPRAFRCLESLLQHAGLDRRQLSALAGDSKETRALRRGRLPAQMVQTRDPAAARGQRRLPSRDCIAQHGRERVDRAAFEAGSGDDELAANAWRTERQRPPLTAGPRSGREDIGPGQVKPELAGGSGETLRPSTPALHPRSIRAKARPARPAEREHGRVRFDLPRSLRSPECRRPGPAHPGHR